MIIPKIKSSNFICVKGIAGYFFISMIYFAKQIEPIADKTKPIGRHNAPKAAAP